MKKNEEDSFEVINAIFKECYSICDPIFDHEIFDTDNRINPAVITTIVFLSEIVRSFDSDLERSNFKLLWDRFYEDYLNISFDDVIESVINEIENKLSKILNKNEFGLGIEYFLEMNDNFENYLYNSKKMKRAWQNKIAKLKSIAQHDSGKTIGSGITSQDYLN